MRFSISLYLIYFSIYFIRKIIAYIYLYENFLINRIYIKKYSILFELNIIYYIIFAYIYISIS